MRCAAVRNVRRGHGRKAMEQHARTALAMQQVAGSIPAQVWRLLSRVRVGPYKRVPRLATARTYTAYAATSWDAKW